MAEGKKISDSIDVHSLSPLRLQAYWLLDKQAEDSDGRLTATRIARHLVEDYDIHTSYQAVDAALQNKKDGAINKNTMGYKLMEKGRQELRKFAKKNPASGDVIFIEAGRPFSAKNESLRTVFGQLSGEVRICDPYIDGHTLDVIFKHLDKSIPVKILTQVVSDRPAGIILRALQDLKKEGLSVEVRVYGNSTLHDRYIMDGVHFWLSGNSLNGLGSKESFVVSLGGDIHQAMSQTFEHRWKAATTYKA